MGCTVLVHSGPNKKGFIGSLPVRGRNYPNEQSVVVIWSHILITFDQVCCFFTVNCENSFFFPNFMAQCLFFLANNFVMQPTKVATIYSWRKRYSQNLAIYTRYEFFFVFKGILLYSWLPTGNYHKNLVIFWWGKKNSKSGGFGSFFFFFFGSFLFL
jgi:hypothetical protein